MRLLERGLLVGRMTSRGRQLTSKAPKGCEARRCSTRISKWRTCAASSRRGRLRTWPSVDEISLLPNELHHFPNTAGASCSKARSAATSLLPLVAKPKQLNTKTKCQLVIRWHFNQTFRRWCSNLASTRAIWRSCTSNKFSRSNVNFHSSHCPIKTRRLCSTSR